MSKQINFVHIALLFSVALNLFFVGLFSGGHFIKSKISKAPPESLYEAANLVDEQYRADVIAILDEQVPKVEQNFEQMYFMFSDMREAIISGENEAIMNMVRFRTEVSERHEQMAGLFMQTIMRIKQVLPEDQQKIFLQEALPETPPFLSPAQVERFKKIKAERQ